MNNENPTVAQKDPTVNVRKMVSEATSNLTDSLERETHRIDHDIEAELGRVNDKFESVNEKFKDMDVKYQIQFNAAKEALGIALIAQEKGTAAALDGTKEAINKAEVATDKRFELLSEKIDGVSEILSKNSGAQGIYVTHSDLAGEMDKLRASFEAMLRPVVTFMNSQTGQQKGIDASWTKLVTIIGITATIITLVIKFAV